MIVAISSNGTSNMSCRTNASRSAGPASRGRSAAPGRGRRPAAPRARGRCRPRGRRSAPAGARRRASRRVGACAACSARHARRRSSATRRGSQLISVDRLSRTHVSWTASSACAQGAEHPIGHGRSRPGGPRTVRQQWCATGSRSSRASRAWRRSARGARDDRQRCTPSTAVVCGSALDAVVAEPPAIDRAHQIFDQVRLRASDRRPRRPYATVLEPLGIAGAARHRQRRVRNPR